MDASGALNLPERLVAFLAERPGADFCNTCLAAVLGTTRHDVDQAVARLARQPDYLQDTWRCTRCSQVRAVIRTVRGSRGGFGGRGRQDEGRSQAP